MPRRPLSFALAALAPLAATLALGCGGSPPPQVASPAAAVSAPCPAATTTDPALAKMSDEELARKLLDVMGSGKLGQQVFDAMLESFRKMPSLPAGFLDRFKQNVHIESLTNIVVRVYLKHLDRTEMIAAINFYTSDQGKRIVGVLPVVTAETMDAAKVWGADLAKKTLKEMGAGGQ